MNLGHPISRPTVRSIVSIRETLYIGLGETAFDFCHIIWVKIFKNAPSKICGTHPLKRLTCMVCLGRPYLFKFYKGCFPQVFLGLFLNTWSHLYRNKYIFDICQEIINQRIKIKKVILAGVLVEIYPIDFNIANP